jgi:hypothetical protein
MKHLDAIIIGTGQARPVLAARFAGARNCLPVTSASSLQPGALSDRIACLARNERIFPLYGANDDLILD